MNDDPNDPLNKIKPKPKERTAIALPHFHEIIPPRTIVATSTFWLIEITQT